MNDKLSTNGLLARTKHKNLASHQCFLILSTLQGAQQGKIDSKTL